MDIDKQELAAALIVGVVFGGGAWIGWNVIKFVAEFVWAGIEIIRLGS